MPRKVLITGAAGFIGAALSIRLLQRGDQVIGLDNLNDYYDPSLKQARLRQVEAAASPGAWRFEHLALEDEQALMTLFAEERPQVVVNLAAQAGVRYSLENPAAYIQSNLVGFGHVLEGCRHHGVENLVYASSSSVYGGNTKTPFSETDPVDAPVSLYAATKRADELMSSTYAHLYGIKQIGLRFFTVYGPWGRPDMAYWTFTDKILKGEAIPVYNHGEMRRDFTYIDDVNEAIERMAGHAPDFSGEDRTHRLYNIGNHTPVPLMTFIAALEQALGKKAEKHMLPMQPGDVKETYADVTRLAADYGFNPSTPIEEGLKHFVDWRLTNRDF